ncbi:MAG TPA: agmatine deiminase [Verrucomicrobiales bacterium]|nr:agmatine deiminase [Verrucomicrobiales bacterium]HCN76934.1 agmatine deiminase [Verrucomicrobiales bacterium]HRJ06954.1 agmatine deiminase family protein [Prosthecobacter sp.]HRK13062.1 agmatine deiminase family protein [Prosthecobacter sp.]
MSKGYPKNHRLPAEFEPQEAVWLSWPSNKESCPKTYLKLQDKFGEIAANMTRYQRVRINAPENMHMGIRLSIADNEGALNMVDLYNHQTNDVWCRDHGPIFIKNDTTGQVSITDWKFDGWGGKFEAGLDNTIPEKAAEVLKMDRYVSDMVLEGGAIETNGKGLLFTTEAVLLNPNRNGGKARKKEEVEKELKAMLGVTDIVWFKKGIEGDDTDGHIDDLVRFVREDAVICMVESKENDPNYKALKQIREQLDDVRTADGSKLEIIEIEMPNAIEARDWRLSRLPASYANFLIVNNAVFVPIFGQKKKDAMAEDKIAECFPGREIISVTCKDLVMEGGALHCIAMHQPK